MLEFLARLHPRKQAVVQGAGLGLAFLIGQTFLGKAHKFYRFKKEFHNGVALGVGIGGGVVVATNLHVLLTDLLAHDVTAPNPSHLPSEAETHSEIKAAIPSEATAVPKRSQPPRSTKSLALVVTQDRSATAAGALAITLTTVAAATVSMMLPSVFSPEGKQGWLTHINYGDKDYVANFRRQAVLGLSWGTGFLAAATGLNWMVEELDSIMGEVDGAPECDVNERGVPDTTSGRAI